MMEELLPKQQSPCRQWGDHQLLLLASAVKRHGVGNWSRVLQELESCGLKNGLHISAEVSFCPILEAFHCFVQSLRIQLVKFPTSPVLLLALRYQDDLGNVCPVIAFAS